MSFPENQPDNIYFSPIFCLESPEWPSNSFPMKKASAETGSAEAFIIQRMELNGMCSW